jgi:hypothetical protein
MSKKKTWAPPGWPWELDALALVFVIIGLAVPYLLSTDHASTAATGDNPATAVLQEQRNVLWAIGIVVLFVMHLAVAGASLETISTPFVHLVSPMAFALLAYYRVFAVARDTGKAAVVTGSPLQITLLVLAVAVTTLLVARIRMARYLLRFDEVKWDVVSKAQYDQSYFELMAELRPLIYPPRLYRASEEGFLIEGWFYIMPVPFTMVQSLTALNSTGFASNGKYHASSARNLIRLELLDNSEPLFISPQNRNEFVQYCTNHVLRLRPSTGGKHTRPGTAAGHTHNGTRKV